MKHSTTSDQRAYWDRYYAGSARTSRPAPSQFAAFVLSELSGRHRIVEFGSGGGRDALFFDLYGHRVLGIDGSGVAVDTATALAAALGQQVRFVQASIDDPSLPETVRAEFEHDTEFDRDTGLDHDAGDDSGTPPDSALPLLVYARFFLHAITDAEESRFLACAATITRSGDRLAVEYRTVRDSSGVKETADHYRRFMSPPDFQKAAMDHGFGVTYAVEGFGFAKYRQDDAYVARSILVRR